MGTFLNLIRYGTKRYVETRVDAVAKKKCSNPNLFEKNISSRLPRKPFFNLFAREHQQQKLSELQFTSFNDFNDPTINFASRTFFASLKSFFAAGHFFLGCPHTTRFIETRFLQWADFFARLERKVPEQLQGRLFLAGATQILASQIKRILLRLRFCHFWSRSPLHKFNGSKAFTWFLP